MNDPNYPGEGTPKNNVRTCATCKHSDVFIGEQPCADCIEHGDEHINWEEPE